MRLPRFSALSISALALSAALAGGVTAGTATAAPHNSTGSGSTVAAAKDSKLAAEARSAKAHGARRAQLRTQQRSASFATDECVQRYPDDTTDPDAPVYATRYSGTDRYETAACVSYGTWFDATDTNPDHQDWVADAVVLARGDLFPDALAGGPLAAQVEGPLLLTSPTQLLPVVRTELQRVLAPGGKVYLLGGTGSLSTGVQNAIVAMGYTPVRIAGSDRFDTAIKIAKAMPSTNEFFVTTGMNFPDALTAGNAAAMYTVGAKYSDDDTDLPVALLFTNNAKMPASIASFIDQRAGQFGDYIGLYAAGGSGYNATVAAGFPVTSRYVGADRYKTAAAIAQGIYTDATTSKLWSSGVGLVNGSNFPDALAGTVLLAEVGDPLLLTTTTTLNATTRSFFQSHAGDITPSAYVDVMGGPGAVSDPVMFAAQSAFTPAS